jgi:hypothetical protein
VLVFADAKTGNTARISPVGVNDWWLGSDGGRKEVAVEGSPRSDGNWSGGRSGPGISRLLAPENELAGALSAAFIPSLPGLRH